MFTQLVIILRWKFVYYKQYQVWYKGSVSFSVLIILIIFLGSYITPIKIAMCTLYTLYLHLFPNYLYLVLSPNTGHQLGPGYFTLINITLCRDLTTMIITYGIFSSVMQTVRLYISSWKCWVICFCRKILLF